jgi:hypothetical protein
MSRELDPGVLIGCQSIARVLQETHSKATIHELIKEAMKQAYNDNHVFMCSTDEQQFKAGVGGVILELTRRGDLESLEYTQRITTEMKVLGALSAATTGIPVDIQGCLPEGFVPFGLLIQFKEAKP